MVAASADYNIMQNVVEERGGDDLGLAVEARNRHGKHRQASLAALDDNERGMPPNPWWDE